MKNEIRENIKDRLVKDKKKYSDVAYAEKILPGSIPGDKLEHLENTIATDEESLKKHSFWHKQWTRDIVMMLLGGGITVLIAWLF